MQEETHTTPGVIAFPPLIYAGPLALGLLLNAVVPVRFLPPSIRWWLGLPLIGSGLVVGAAAIGTLRRAGTNVNPNAPTTALVTNGPFRFSRNPIYLAFTLLYGGITVVANALWAVLPLPIILAVMQRGVIEREERYLDRTFGTAYRQYQARVRRWL
jgi:protein-S-isoprenylcysteine O-methyltransferase Ste14